jgi:anti-sigma regulatory factor (Ser/Thr protein kinase)
VSAWQVADDLADDVRVVVSELATNAVLHARTPFAVSATCDGTRLRVAVADQSATLPRLRRRDSSDATTGRGLAMVACLSARWGVDETGEGKTTWCEFDLQPLVGCC